jgi:hypothetical protein
MEWTIQDFGSAGEFIGSIAVLVTLIILVVQVRTARTEISSQMAREFKRHNNDAFHQLTQNTELLNIYIQAQRDYESLTDAEKVRWALWLFTWITQTEDGFIARQAGIGNMGWVDSYITGVAQTLRSEGGKEVWPRQKGFFDPEFVEAVDRTVAADTTTFMQQLLE